MRVLALAVSLLVLALAGLPFSRRRCRTLYGLLVVNFFGPALAPYLAVAGGLGAGLGLWAGSLPAVLAGVAGTCLAVDSIRRVTAPHQGFEAAFGPTWRARIPPQEQSRLPEQRFSWRLPRVAAPRLSRDVPFWTLPGTGRRLLADLWQPPAEVPASGTAVVYLHGGGWYLLDKDVLTRPFFRQLASQGHLVLDVAYRPCPETDVTGMVGDALRAVAWLRERAGAYGIDPGRIVLMGASAGAHVALLAAYAGRDPRFFPEDLAGLNTTVAGVVSYYGVADLRAYGVHLGARMKDFPEAPGPTKPRHRPGLLTDVLNRLLLGRVLTAAQSPPTPRHVQMMRDLVGGLPDEVPEMFDLASPITHAGPGCPATLLFHGAHDAIVPVASARALYRALRAAGVPVVYVEYPRTKHAFDLLYPPLMCPAAKAALHDAQWFLAMVGR